MKSIALSLVVFAAVAAAAASARADVARWADGRYTFNNTRYMRDDGSTLLSVDYQTVSYDYVKARGVYGGGYSASGRMKAKTRASNKVILCLDVFYRKGVTSSSWDELCGADEVYVSDAYPWTNFPYFSSFLASQLCPTANYLRLQFGYGGPIVVTTNVGLWADAEGTEADRVESAGQASVTCY